MLLGKMVVPLKAMVLALMQTVVGLVVLAQTVMALQRTEVALAAIVVAWRPFEILYSINNISDYIFILLIMITNYISGGYKYILTTAIMK